MLARSSKRRRRRQNSNMLDPNAWKQDCALLLETMLESDDSIPFRHAVEIDEFPDYLQVVTSPMDLATVRGRLTSGAYDTALEFCKDVRLVFKNSRSYNTNKRSRIYAMTLRLSAMFEDQFQGILSEYNSSNKHRKNPHRTSHRRFNHGATTSQSLRSSHPTFSNFTTPSNVDALPSETVVTSRRRNLPRIQGSSSCSNSRPAKRLRAVVSDSESELHPRGQTSTDFSQPSRRIKTRSKVPPKRLKYRVGADEEDDEEDEDGLQNHKSEEEEGEEEDDSDEDFQVRRRKKQPVKKSTKKPPKIKKSSSKQKLKMNGAKKQSSSKSDRYGTRCATGSLKRKRYDRGFSDAEDEELSVDEASKETRPPNANGNRVRIPDARAINAATSSDSSSDANSSSDDSESESHQSSSGTEEYTDQSGPTERPPPPRARNGESGKKLSRVQIADDSSQQSGESESAQEKSARYSTRNQGRRTVRYQEDSDPDRGDAFLDHDLSDTDVERSVTVSSRGRIRRPNPRVRTSL